MQRAVVLPEASCGRLKPCYRERKVHRQGPTRTSTDEFLALCKHSEDLSDEEKAAELLPINIQRIHVLERLGKSAEAKAVASEVKAEE